LRFTNHGNTRICLGAAAICSSSEPVPHRMQRIRVGLYTMTLAWPPSRSSGTSVQSFGEGDDGCTWPCTGPVRILSARRCRTQQSLSRACGPGGIAAHCSRRKSELRRMPRARAWPASRSDGTDAGRLRCMTRSAGFRRRDLRSQCRAVSVAVRVENLLGVLDRIVMTRRGVA